MLKTSLVIVGAAALLAGCGADPVQGPYSYSGSDVEGPYVYRDNRVSGTTEYKHSADDEAAVTASSRVETTVEKSTEPAAAVAPAREVDDPTRPLAKVDNDTVKVTNRSDKELRDVTVLVNGGKYTTHVDTIAPHSSVTIDRDQMKSALGEPMPTATHVDKIELRGAGKALYEYNPPHANE